MYKELLDRFTLNLESLKMYVESAREVLKMEEDFLEKNAGAFMLMEYWNIKQGAKSVLDVNTKEELLELFDTEIIKEYSADKGKINITFNNHKMAKKFEDSIDKLKCKLKQTDILYSGTLMLLVVYFEEMFSKMLLKDLLKYPRIKIENNTLTFEEIKDLGSIDEAKKYLIEKEVDKIMKEKCDDWFKYLKQTVKLKLKCYDDHVSYFNEIMARRNLIVHNDGIVNTYYLNRVGKNNIYNVKLGDVLSVDSKYILEAFDVFEQIAVNTLVEIYLKENLDEDKIDNVFNLVTNKYLFEEKYTIALKLYELLLDCKFVKGELKLFCELNYWQCHKWLGITNDKIEKLNKFDYSVYKTKIHLGALALQEKYDDFFEAFNVQDEIRLVDLKNWPIFKEVRKDERFLELIKPKEIEEPEFIVEEESELS